MRNIMFGKAVLFLAFVFSLSGCLDGEKNSTDASSVVPEKTTLQSEIHNINSQLNQGKSALSKLDVAVLVQEGLLQEKEDSDAVDFFVGGQ